ncbi:3-hydroxyisobutyrate dehydrogenase [Aspergillus steynii IBT 23096]|uniref:3-hydroxyisobutyrate dehydrogenase n=1 Tax=Aspergillus steynii IBT 23096 TaxID=1392250 RepID=A0A2I2FU05_9EURO|nr:3-hydroxyisobutyrate dehydrogenase [Aspergillus steynii IBT 23096]PLB44125.1 3-hydroxyisobutyrate dehydrogenase [Aspergillus steynii IBT 23096]
MRNPSSPRIGWYGLGSMGRPMAENLQQYLANYEQPNLTYYNRTMSTGADLEALGAVPAYSYGDLVANCDLIFTMVANDGVLQDLMRGVANDGQIQGKVFVDCSTVHPDTAANVSELLAMNGGRFLSAPVFGGPAIASSGKLVFAIGGPSENVETVKGYILDVMGRKIIDCGEKAQNAALLKVGGNIITLNLMEAVGEAHVFAEKTGLGDAAMQELISESFGAVAGGYSQRLTSGIYAPPLDTRPGFGVSLAIKDAAHALSIASQNNVKLPGLEVADRNMQAARKYAGECLDSSSMYGTLRREAGETFWNESSRQGGK